MKLIVITNLLAFSNAFIPNSINQRRSTLLSAAPTRLEENVDGVLYVNDKCINCSACSSFAPNVFHRSPTDNYHVVYHQPDSPLEVDHARAALAACPVAAIRVESQAQRSHNNLESLSESEVELAESLALSPSLNNLELPFPRPSNSIPGIYNVGFHNEASFGATPYLTQVEVDKKLTWIMVDTPKFSKRSKEAVTSLTGPDGPEFLFLTHVDDVGDHNKWKEEFPSMKRIFHEGDLGRYNWIGDSTLENVEILLPSIANDDNDALSMFTVDGKLLKSLDDTSDDVVILHTPGHSPGSITLYQRPSTTRPGVVFTGDTYGYTTRTNSMTAFPQYGNDLRTQEQVLKKLLNDYDWSVVLPGHGHSKDYSHVQNKQQEKERDMEEAISAMKVSRRW